MVPAADIEASTPDERDAFFDPAADKNYRHPTFYDVPEGVEHLLMRPPALSTYTPLARRRRPDPRPALGWWISRAPELEEDVALANIGLDQLGQAAPAGLRR